MWRKIVNPTGNGGNNTLVAVQGGCCNETQDLSACVIASHNVASTPINRLVIGGNTYTFTTSADTALELETGINEALEAAGYIDAESYGTLVTGANTAVYVSVQIDGTITKLMTVGGADVNFTCS